MIEILEIISTVFIFSGMGTGKETGKLLFKKLCSSGAFLIEDDGTSMTFSSSGSGISIPVDEIAFGTGTSITSSPNFKVCQLNQSIIGKFQSTRSYHKLETASEVSNSPRAFIVAGCQNKIDSSPYSTIIGGSTNSINSNSNFSSILGGKQNDICSSFHSSVISGCKNCICGSYGFSIVHNSSIIGGSSNCIKNTEFSTIVSGESNLISDLDSNSTPRSCFLSILNSSSSKISHTNANAGSTEFWQNVIISAAASEIKAVSTFSVANSLIPNGLAGITSYNNILSSCRSCIDDYRTCLGARHNTILSSGNSSADGYFSNIISSEFSNIYSIPFITQSDTGGVITFTNKHSQIISSYRSCLLGNYSQIISSNCSCILTGDTSYNQNSPVTEPVQFNQILSGYKNCIINTDFLKPTIFSSIIGGCKNKHLGSFEDSRFKYFTGHSIMISGSENYTKGQNQIFGGACNKTYYNEYAKGNTILINSLCNVTANSVIINSVSKPVTPTINALSISNLCAESGYQFSSIFGQPGDPNSWTGITSSHCSTVISSSAVKSTSDYNSVIVSTIQSCISNTVNSVILSGKEHCMRGVGDFATSSEGWLAGTPEVINPSPPDTLCNNFIIAGQCNKFLSNTSDGLGSQISVSKSFNICHSGIIGGCGNCIVNECQVINSITHISTSKIKNIVISGGSNIKISRSNTFATCCLIVAGGISTKYCCQGSTLIGQTGLFNNVTQLRIVNGLVVGVVSTSDMRLKIIIKKIGQSNWNLNIYLFRYISDPERVYQGVIAQELLNTKYESAVSIDQNGFYQVDYSKIDVEFKEIDYAKKDFQYSSM